MEIRNDVTADRLIVQGFVIRDNARLRALRKCSSVYVHVIESSSTLLCRHHGTKLLPFHTRHYLVLSGAWYRRVDVIMRNRIRSSEGVMTTHRKHTMPEANLKKKLYRDQFPLVSGRPRSLSVRLRAVNDDEESTYRLEPAGVSVGQPM